MYRLGSLRACTVCAAVWDQKTPKTKPHRRFWREAECQQVTQNQKFWFQVLYFVWEQISITWKCKQRSLWGEGKRDLLQHEEAEAQQWGPPRYPATGERVSGKVKTSLVWSLLSSWLTVSSSMCRNSDAIHCSSPCIKGCIISLASVPAFLFLLVFFSKTPWGVFSTADFDVVFRGECGTKGWLESREPGICLVSTESLLLSVACCGFRSSGTAPGS